MSRYSGKCDLYDTMCGLGGWYDKDGNKVSFNDHEVGCFYSDLMQDFEAFKERTHGKLYQHYNIKQVDSWNQDFVKDHCPNFDIIKHVETRPSKRSKLGTEEHVYYTYMYFGKEYTRKELSKKGGVYIRDEIKFNTLLDLIPYFPYIVTMSYSFDGEMAVFISDESYVEEERKLALDNGRNDTMAEHYRKELADLYQKVVLEYFNPEGREHIELVKFDENGVGKVSHSIDYNFDVKWRWEDNEIHNHWTSPKVIDYAEGTIKMSEQDYNYYLPHEMLVYYVEPKKGELDLQ